MPLPLPAATLPLDIYCRFIAGCAERTSSSVWIGQQPELPATSPASAYCRQFTELYCPADATAFAFYGGRFQPCFELALGSDAGVDEVGDSNVRRGAVRLRSIDN